MLDRASSGEERGDRTGVMSLGRGDSKPFFVDNVTVAIVQEVIEAAQVRGRHMDLWHRGELGRPRWRSIRHRIPGSQRVRALNHGFRAGTCSRRQASTAWLTRASG